jgi:hypothetical protein
MATTYAADSCRLELLPDDHWDIARTFVARLNGPRSANEPQVSSPRKRQNDLASQRASAIYK